MKALLVRICYIILIQLLILPDTLAQIPEPAFNPMTAPGAKGIHWNNHTLYWENSSGTIYNEVYFSDDSMKVAYKDTTVRVRNGFPSTIFSSCALNAYGPLNISTKYYWRVVEFNSSGSSASDLWAFKSQGPWVLSNNWNFGNGLEGWQIVGPQGFSNWYWSNTTHTGSKPGEIVFRWDPVFMGNSYIMSPEVSSASGVHTVFDFRFYEDWWSDTVEVGFAITTDNGNLWSTLWELHATGNVGPQQVIISSEVPDDFRLGFFYTGDSNNIDFLYVDNVSFSSVLSPPIAPSLLTAIANDSIKKVSLSWDAGSGFGGVTGYVIQRKSGNPASSEIFSTVATTNASTLVYEDFDVDLNQTYTYRVRTYSFPGSSCYGNEATAYVPVIVPVELTSFNAEAFGKAVNLFWTTASETNNRGFEVERKSGVKSQTSNSWMTIGFVEGRGTTTETQSYRYADDKITSGRYQYRLRQIDYDGSYEYSNVVEVDVNIVKGFILEQNYPNPFNPSTKISWQSPVGSHQTIKVYDVLGNEVATLVDEFREAGRYEIEFSASGGGAVNLSSGIYYYQLRAGNLIESRKMLLLK